MVSSSPYRAAIKKRAVRNLFLMNLLFILQLSLTGHVNAQVATQSGYSLIGTIQSDDFTGAVISVSKGEQSFFRLFEKLPDGSQIVAVRPDYITLKGTDGLSYELFILHETKNIAAVPFSPLDPFAGATRKPPSERPLSAYKRGRLDRLGKHNSDDE